jgi:hypothetical protein
VSVMRREGPFHDDRLVHGTLEAYRHAFGTVVESVMSIALEAVLGEF